MRIVRDESGQAALEFALVLPILVLVVTAIVQLGMLFSHYLALTDAVRAGARVAAVSRTSATPQADVCAAVTSAASDLNLQCGTSITMTPSSNLTAGSPVTVTASTPYTLSIFGLPVKSGSLTSTTTERVE